MKKIAILGSTGSIGTQTLEVVSLHNNIQVVAMSAGRNITLFERQIRKFQPKIVSVADQETAVQLQERISDLSLTVRYGIEGMIEVATHTEAELVVTAVVGMIGIRPTIAAIRANKDIALANKETLVCAGHLIMPLIKKHKVQLLPVDSEHSAVFQSLQGNDANPIERILLTASGGPFLGKTCKELSEVTVEDALHHPNWSMGKKITIDSATLVNKGLEVIEAKWLFDVDVEQIQVVVHPQSVIHSAVQYRDGAVLAQLGTPDMKIPIQYALYYPKRLHLPEKRLDLFALKSLTFMEPDEKVFKGIALARKAVSIGGNMPTILNAANECAVDLFLHQKISFLEITKLIESCMEQIPFAENPTIDEILETERAVYQLIESR